MCSFFVVEGLFFFMFCFSYVRYILVLFNVNGVQTAEEEKALREQERNVGASSGVTKPGEVELDNVAATNGRYSPVLLHECQKINLFFLWFPLSVLVFVLVLIGAGYK